VDSPASAKDPAPDLPARLHLALRAALKARDTAAVSALRSALSAISNAEAIEHGPAPAAMDGSPHIAGAVAGLGAGEVQRRHLTGAQVDQIVQAEITECHRAAREYDQAGHSDRADRLRRIAGVLQSVRQA
jgi:uncharacterized protein YqeY